MPLFKRSEFVFERPLPKQPLCRLAVMKAVLVSTALGGPSTPKTVETARCSSPMGRAPGEHMVRVSLEGDLWSSTPCSQLSLKRLVFLEASCLMLRLDESHKCYSSWRQKTQKRNKTSPLKKVHCGLPPYLWPAQNDISFLSA